MQPTCTSQINPFRGPEPLISSLGPILFFGFAAALVIWCAWFITHLPWVGMPESTSMPLLLALWIFVSVCAGLGRTRNAALRVGFGSGLLTALLGLLILGSKVSEPAPGFEALRPNILLIAFGFLTAGAFIGVVGGLAGSALPFRPSQPATNRTYLPRFGILTMLSFTPVLVAGGLVTSTNSGMAVPDWPNTFGSNMFLYPLGPRAAPDVYLEHAHRLFGTFVGLATLTLMIWVLLTEPRRWVRNLAITAFLLVCFQGLLGAWRVLRGSTVVAEDPSLERMLHGVLAQLVFGVVVAIAVVLTPTFKRARDAMSDAIPAVNARVLRFCATGLLHATILQLILGAAYRHTRSAHSLWSHIAFSIIVVCFAVAVSSAAMNIKQHLGGIGPVLRRTGVIVFALVLIQFMLGWLSFGFGGHSLQAGSPLQAIIRTSHQANGALFLACITVAYVWTKRLLWIQRRMLPEGILIATPASTPRLTPAPLSTR